MRGVTEEQKKQAAAMFAEGALVEKVRKALGIGWITAKNLQGSAKPDKRAPRQKANSEPDEYELQLTMRVSVERVDAILKGLSLQEKMDALAYVMQARMEAGA